MAADECNDEDAVSIVTTLHYVTQTQRMGTISEATGRASMFLTSVSMSLVALGFIGQATDFSSTFRMFAFALLAVLILIGWLTFLRAVQLSAEDGELADEGERIRCWYADRVPAIRELVAPPQADGGPDSLAAAPAKMRGQLFLTAHSMIAAVNAALAGVAVGLAIATQRRFTLEAAALTGLVAFALVATAQMLLARRAWRRADALTSRRRPQRPG